MMHPHTELRTVSPEIGVGVFATRRIPKGTITYVVDPLEITVPPDSPLLEIPALRRVIETYAIIKPNGEYELSWDYAKYMNHCCHYNTLTTGFGFDVAIRDIEAGEQILCDYGMFNVDYPMELICTFKDCRLKVRADDYDRCQAQWESDVQSALRETGALAQPLIDVIDPETRGRFESYLQTGEGYISVSVHRRIRTHADAGDHSSRRP